MESEYQTIDDHILLGEPLDQGLEDGQLVLNAGGHGGGTAEDITSLLVWLWTTWEWSKPCSVLNNADETNTGSLGDELLSPVSAIITHDACIRFLGGSWEVSVAAAGWLFEYQV